MACILEAGVSSSASCQFAFARDLNLLPSLVGTLASLEHLQHLLWTVFRPRSVDPLTFLPTSACAQIYTRVYFLSMLIEPKNLAQAGDALATLRSAEP